VQGLVSIKEWITRRLCGAKSKRFDHTKQWRHGASGEIVKFGWLTDWSPDGTTTGDQRQVI